jgi:hypothetical protein
MKSHEIPIKSPFITIFLWFSYGFPMVFKVEDITWQRKACQTLTLMLKIGQVHAGPKRLQGFPQVNIIGLGLSITIYTYRL